MFGFGTRRKLLKLERRFQRIEAQLAGIAQAVTNGHQAPSYDPASILKAALDGQGAQIASTSEFIRTIHEIGTERMAAALGRRGGKARAKTAQRDTRGRMLPARARPDCTLCDDPLTADFSISQWEEHQKHKGGKRNEPERRERERDRDIEIEREPEHHVHADGTVHAGPPHPEYPLRVLAQGDTNGGSSGDPSAGSEPGN